MADQLRLTFFGTAAGFPTKTRPGNTAIGLWRGSAVYLFDAGEGVAAQFARLGLSPDALRAIFITHPHADHVGGLPMLIQWLQLNERTAPLSVYVPDASLEGLRHCLRLIYLYPMSEFDLDLRPAAEGSVHEEEGLSVVAVHSRHLEPSEERRRRNGARAESQAFCYLISADGRSIYLSGDIADPQEVVEHVQGVDLAVVEMAHFTPEALGEALSASHTPRLVLTHIRDDYEPIERELATRVRSGGFRGDIRVARDGDEITL